MGIHYFWGAILVLGSVYPYSKSNHLFPFFSVPNENGTSDVLNKKIVQELSCNQFFFRPTEAAKSNPDFVVNVGDNFYWGGLLSWGPTSHQGCGALEEPI